MDEPGEGYRHGHRELWSYPVCGSPPRLSLEQLYGAARAAEEDLTGWPFLFFYENGREIPYCIEGGIEALIEFTDFAGHQRVDFWQLRESGFFFQRTPMWEDSFARAHDARPVMDVRAFALYAALGLRCVTKLYGQLFDESTPVTIGVRVTNAEGRRLQFPDNPATPPLAGCISGLQEIECVRTHALAGWKAGLVDHAVSVCDHVLRRFNWVTPDLRVCRQVIEEPSARQIDR